ncbi:MAG: caspase family protein, partial [Boseongicola sp.]
MKHLTLAAAFAAGLAAAAHADDVALVIGNEDYRGVPDVRRGDDVANAERGLARQKVKMVIGRDATRAEFQEAIETFAQIVTEADRMLIVLSGRFVHSETETYFLPTDIGAPSLQTVSRDGLSLSVVLAYLSATPGQSILGLATDGTEGSYGNFLTVGIGEIDLPQGVTLLRSDPQRMARFLNRTLTQPGEVIGDAAARAGIAVSGFAPKGQMFLPIPEPEVVPPTPQPTTSGDSRLQDLLAWREADRIDTADAYQNYIDNYPTGQFIRMAENRVKAATDAPE